MTNKIGKMMAIGMVMEWGMNTETVSKVTIGAAIVLGVVSIGLLATGNTLWAALLGSSATVLFGASVLCQRNQPGSYVTQAINPERDAVVAEEEEEVDEPASSHERVLSELGQQQGLTKEAIMLPGEASGTTRPISPAAETLQQEVDAVTGETSADNPAPTPRTF